jgi:hypothetical protein
MRRHIRRAYAIADGSRIVGVRTKTVQYGGRLYTHAVVRQNEDGNYAMLSWHTSDADATRARRMWGRFDARVAVLPVLVSTTERTIGDVWRD